MGNVEGKGKWVELLDSVNFPIKGFFDFFKMSRRGFGKGAHDAEWKIFARGTIRGLLVVVGKQVHGMAFVETDATTCNLGIGSFYFEYDFFARTLLHKALEGATTYATAPKTGTDGKVFYIDEVGEMPGGNKAAIVAVVKDGIGVEEGRLVHQFFPGGLGATFFFRKGGEVE